MILFRGNFINRKNIKPRVNGFILIDTLLAIIVVSIFVFGLVSLELTNSKAIYNLQKNILEIIAISNELNLSLFNEYK